MNPARQTNPETKSSMEVGSANVSLPFFNQILKEHPLAM